MRWTPRAKFDEAQQTLLSAQAQVDAAQAQVRIAQDQLSYTVLFADAPGAVTAIGAEPGEVVHAGQMIVQLARQGGRDAVFDVPEQLIRTGPRDPVVQIALTNDPTVRATGRVREVSPQADPAPARSRSRSASSIRRRPCGWAPPSPAASSWPPPPAWRFRRARSPRRTAARPCGSSIRRARPCRCATWMCCATTRRPSCLAGAGNRRDRRHRRRADAAPGPEGPAAGSRVMKRFNLSEWALRHRSLGDLFHARHRGRGHLVLLPARAERGPGLHRQDHGGAGRLAGRHGRRHARADHRPHRAQAAGDAEPRLPEELHHARARPRSSST